MATFIGIVALTEPLSDRFCADLTSAVTAGLPAPAADIRRCENAFFIQTDGSGLFSGPDGHSLFGAEARLDNRSELAAIVGLSAAELTGIPDAALLFRVFDRCGADGIARCLGAFAFAHWDWRSRRLTLGRDCLGHSSLLFHRTRDRVLFSNRLGVLLAAPGVIREVDDIALTSFLATNWNDRHRTAYRGVERTPSRTLVSVSRAGVSHRYYWSPKFDAPPPYRRDEDYVERARELFDQAVLSATDNHGEIAIAASGGLDSSAIAATAARLGRARRIRCYTTLPPVDADIPIAAHRYRDERDKVESLGRVYPQLELNWLTQERLHPIEADESRYFSLALVPRRNGLSVGGVAMMLDALSGQSLVLFGSLGNLCLSWAGRFALLALLREQNWNAFARELAATARRKGMSRARVLQSDVIRQGAPIGLRMLWRRLRGQDSRSVLARYTALNPHFIEQSGIAEIWREQKFNPAPEVDGWNPARLRAWHVFDKTGADRDNLSWPERVCGLASRDPFADRRLLEFALSIPEPLYHRDGVPRSFARAVFADRLPREILQETRRGVHRLAWFRNLDRRRPHIAAQVECMESSATARRLLDIPRLKRLLDDWPKDERAAHSRQIEYSSVLARAVHVGNFIRWVESGSA